LRSLLAGLYRLSGEPFYGPRPWVSWGHYVCLTLSDAAASTAASLARFSSLVLLLPLDTVNAMLLNQFLKEHKASVEEHGTVRELKSTVAQLKSGMEALTATVREQATQIQKVSAQLQASKPATQVVNNP
jgi:hypothetical protein